MAATEIGPRGERRAHQRVSVRLSATISTAERALAATLRSISRSGASIELDVPVTLRRGARVVLTGDAAALRDCSAKVIEGDGSLWRLAFDRALPAAEFLGVAKALNG